MPTALALLCAELSSRGRIAYVEAESFGGQGEQAALLAEDGKLVGEPNVFLNAINGALSFIGVKQGDAHDEFDAVGLGRERDTEQW